MYVATKTATATASGAPLINSRDQSNYLEISCPFFIDSAVLHSLPDLQSPVHQSRLCLSPSLVSGLWSHQFHRFRIVERRMCSYADSSTEPTTHLRSEQLFHYHVERALACVLLLRDYIVANGPFIVSERNYSAYMRVVASHFLFANGKCTVCQALVKRQPWKRIFVLQLRRLLLLCHIVIIASLPPSINHMINLFIVAAVVFRIIMITSSHLPILLHISFRLTH